MSLERIGVDETRPILSHIRMGGEKREDVTSSNTCIYAQGRQGGGGREFGTISGPSATRPASAFVFAGTAGGLPMRHVGLPQLAVFVRPLF